MIGRSARVVALLVIAGAVAASPSGLMAKTTHRCPPHGQTILQTNAVALLYGSSGHAIGCARPHGRSFVLYDSDEYDTGFGLRLAGPFAAYVFDRIDPCSKYAQCSSTGSTVVAVVDLRSGHRRRSPDQDLPGSPTLTSSGIAAWMNTAGDGVVSVRTLGSHGVKTLDANKTIDAKSLSLRGTTLTWTKGGEPQSATLSAR